MQPSWKLFLGAYLLLSAAACVALAMLIEEELSECLSYIPVVAAGNFVLQLLFVATGGSLRYIGPMAPWRQLLCSGFVTVLLAAEAWDLVGTWSVLTNAQSLDDETSFRLLALAATATLWVLWRWWRWCCRQDRLIVMRRMATVPAVAAIVQLSLGAWAHHIIVARPDVALADIAPSLAILLFMIVDVLILTWSLGPLFVWLYYRRVRRQMRGICLACGYDLHGLSQQRCPECGRAFTFEEVHATAAELGIPTIDPAESSEAPGR